MSTIAEELVDRSPRDAFRAALIASLARRGVDNVTMVDDVLPASRGSERSPPGTSFEIGIEDVVFRECGKRWTFCGEMKIRGRLRDLASGRLLYQGTLVYSNASARSSFGAPDRMPYERIANADAPCRPIEEYCAPGGAKVFAGDLGAAARFLAERLLDEAGVSRGRDGEAPIGKGPRRDVVPLP